MISTLILLFFGYLIQLFSLLIEVIIMNKVGTKNMTAGNAFRISIIGYLVFVAGFLFLYNWLF